MEESAEEGVEGTPQEVRAFLCDTNVLVRFLTNDSPVQALAVERIFDSAREGRVIVIIPDVIFAELAYVLTRVYELRANEAAARISGILELPGIEAADDSLVRDALGIWAAERLDFEDAYLAALAKSTSDVGLLSFDRDFDRIEGVERSDPRAVALRAGGH